MENISAREMLRQHGVEIALDDCRPLEEIVRALGLAAARGGELELASTAKADRIERGESRPYFA